VTIHFPPAHPGVRVLRIERCVCVNVTFAEMKEAVRAEGLDVEGLERKYGCCRGCGLCAPYVRRMMRTGETCFGEILSERDEPVR
jgi:bacterioferritin-associated ferredoxin